MSAPHAHPRRRPQKASSPPLSSHAMSLRKSGTFHAPKSVSSDICGLDNAQHMPRRSPTSTESLEQLLQEPSVLRVANLLKDFDQRIAGHKSAAAAASASSLTDNILSDPEVLPVPRFVLDNSTLDDSSCMDIDPKPAAAPVQDHSDSGLGSSIGGSKTGRIPGAESSSTTSVTSSHSAVTRSFAAVGAAEEKHTLGEYACKQIHDHIVKPILAEEALKDFHPLIQDVPRRIGEKNICNLRDLEKTLIFLAPELSATPSSYLLFCERSIQLLHATVDRLSEPDQRLPADRPYTNNYFLDLVQQIRRYAAIMAATRRKEEAGEDLDEMDYSRDEKITLRGGLSHNGRPAELVREKDGKVIPLAEGADTNTYTGFSPSKRALDADDMDADEATRSMARRRKSDKPGDVLHTCRDCKKDFKRPCDLTKHEKTHSRPWKCTDESCKYFELGWPTEKERDRHVNDKHSAAPAQYRCLYPPCTYASKRESNCKQHMEKAHGWEYVRSKSNGRKKAPAPGGQRAPPTPMTPYMDTPQSVLLPSPITPFDVSPAVPALGSFDYPCGFDTPAMSVHGFHDEFRRDSTTTDGSHFTYSSTHSPLGPSSFEDAVSLEDAHISHANDLFPNCGLDASFTAFQQPTPAMSAPFDFDALNYAVPPPPTTVPHLSPAGQADMTLFSPQMHLDEGFVDTVDMGFTRPTDGFARPTEGFARPTEDFALFPTAQDGNIGLSDTTGFFPDYNQVGGQFDNLYVEPATPLDDLLNQGFGNP